jgi:hypothetical protein
MTGIKHFIRDIIVCFPYNKYVGCVFKVFFILKYIKIIFFFIFKKLFLILAYQNDTKNIKKY